MTDDRRPVSEKSTAALVTRGAALFMTMRWSVRGIGLISTIVLARLLVPTDFGLVAIATSYIAILSTLTDLGARSATIRRGVYDRNFLDTVLTLQLFRGVAIAVIVLASSLVLPGIMKDQRLTLVLACLALEPLISAFINPRMALYEGQLNFGPEAILQISAKVLSTTLTITVAFWQHSYWALVAGTLIASFARVLISYALSPAVPRFGLQAWRELFHFSGWVTAASIFDSLANGFDQLIVSAFLNIRTAGLYNVGATLATMPLGEFLPVVNRALMPGLLKFKNDSEKLRQVTLDVTALLAGLSLPIGIGFCFVAPEFVRIFYGPKWADSIPIVQVLSLCGALGSIGGAVASSIAMTLGRTELLFRRSAMTLAMRLPPFLIGIWLYGLIGAFVGYFMGSLAVLISNLMILHDTLSITYARLVRQLVTSTVSALSMSVFLFILAAQLPRTGGPAQDAMEMTIKIAVGLVTYSLTRLLIWKLTGAPESLDLRVRGIAKAAMARIGRRVALPGKISNTDPIGK
jgi:PST family polysaccharide transporter